MKQIIAIICLAVAVASCNNGATTTSGTDSTGATKPAADVALPFKLDKPYRNWNIGSTENVAAVMTALKAFNDKDFAALGTGIGDSIELRFDYYTAKLSRDSAVKFFAAERAKYGDIAISMYDYVSVISADKTEEYVTLWYKQTWTDAKGVADSLSIVNDCKMKNGKMIELDEKAQHFAKK